jgi:hypothetical protein
MATSYKPFGEFAKHLATNRDPITEKYRINKNACLKLLPFPLVVCGDFPHIRNSGKFVSSRSNERVLWTKGLKNQLARLLLAKNRHLALALTCKITPTLLLSPKAEYYEICDIRCRTDV